MESAKLSRQEDDKLYALVSYLRYLMRTEKECCVAMDKLKALLEFTSQNSEPVKSQCEEQVNAVWRALVSAFYVVQQETTRCEEEIASLLPKTNVWYKSSDGGDFSVSKSSSRNISVIWNNQNLRDIL